MKRVLIALLLLAGCQTYSLDSKWEPLTELVERPSLPFVGDDTLTTRGSHVYLTDLDGFLRDIPPDSDQFAALMLHEQLHAQRQFRYKGLPGELALYSWIGRYLTDAKFRWQEESLAWELEIRHYVKTGLWQGEASVESVARTLSGGYVINGEPMVSYQDAKLWVESVTR